MKELYRSDDNRCIIAVGDITNIACDAIVNAGNIDYVSDCDYAAVVIRSI